MMKKALAVAALAIVAIFAVPTAANAYVPPSNISSPGSLAPGETGTVSFAPGSFTPGEPVSFTLTGENASGATLASVVSAVDSQSITKSADASGSAALSVTLPLNASGAYSITATGLESGRIATVAISTGAPSDSGTGTTSGTGSSSGSLPNTGAMDPTLGIWAGGGLLALGAAFVIVLTIVRRQKSSVNS
ncbi:LPXTG cell wall anchor domain-containing protein [Herbiconiux sp. 11R-BC]|uniref:LPXTG cell wall anchor domain-containing protein n=1 Tax=Herbiconiux sp. 11R-BC TaxID=3111637 RepID=UPI003BFE7997